MGWNNGGAYRSATAMVELGTHIAHTVSASEWRTIQPLFQQANSGQGPFDIPAVDAARYAQVFRAAAGHRLMPAFWATSARELADVADRHANTGQPWSWY